MQSFWHRALGTNSMNGILLKKCAPIRLVKLMPNAGQWDMHGRKFVAGDFFSLREVDGGVHRSVYTRMRLHTEAFTHRSLHALKLLRRVAFKQRSLYTEKS